MYSTLWVQRKNYIYKSFRLVFTCRKKEPEPTPNFGARSNFKSTPALANKPLLRSAPAPQHWLSVYKTYYFGTFLFRFCMK